MWLKNLVFLGNYYPEQLDDYVRSKSIDIVPFSSVNFNRKLISGFPSERLKINIVSPIYFGAFPKHSRELFVKKFKLDTNEHTVPYFNFVYLNNICKSLMLKKRTRKIDLVDLIIVSEIHLPYLQAAIKLKKRTKSKILLCVLDLPQFMSFQATSVLYKMAKWIDIKKINKLLRQVDYFYFLNEGMNDINSSGRPYIVREGLVSGGIQHDFKENEDFFLYSGSLEEGFNIREMITSFICASEKSMKKFKLVICGNGSLKNYVENISKNNPQVVYLGLVSPTEVRKLQDAAYAFINPRKPIDTFTKYSFPSKNFEYLEHGKPTISFPFSSNNSKLANWFINPYDGKTNFVETILSVMNLDQQSLKKIFDESRGLLEMYLPRKVFLDIEQLISNDN